MALLQVRHQSAALKLSMGVNVIVPEQPQYPDPSPRKEYSVLYLLHGSTQDHSHWLRYTRVESYVQNRDLVVVMPEVHRSFYTNTYSRQHYFDYLSKELPAFCAATFPILTDREHTFAAGLSMGGFGALKLGLCCPGQFAAVAVLSGVVDLIANFGRKNEDWQQEFSHTLNRAHLPGSEDDLPEVAERLIASGKPIPRIYQTCGTQDSLLPYNRSFYERFQGRLPITYDERPGTHDWAYWDAAIQRVLDWI